MEVLLVPLALLVIATPPLTLFLLWRQRKLRQQIVKLAELSAQQNDVLHRELLELKRQVASAPRVAPPAAAVHPVVTPLSPAVTAPPIEKTPTPIAPPITKPVVPPAIPTPPVSAVKTPEVVLEHEKHVIARMGPLAAPPQKGEPREEKPSPIVPAKEHKPLTPPISAEPARPVAPPHQPEATHPSAMPVPPKETPHPATAPPVAARVIAPPQFAALRSAAPKRTTQQRMKSVFALEEALGTNWLNKLGIIILVFGVALFGIYELGQLGPGGKVSLSYVVAAALLGGGIFLEKRERYRVLGRTLIGGGWALLFFTTYAMSHVKAMHVIDSETFDLILMLAVAIAMVAHTLRYRSQLVTGLSFLLAYSTVALSHDDVYSLSSGVVLAFGLVSIVIKMGWFELEIFGILSSYLNHLYWLYRLLGAEGAQGHAFPEYRASTALLLFYWVIFRVSYVVRRPRSPREEHLSTAAALLNTLLLLGVMRFQSVQPQLAYIALLIIGAVEFSIGQLSIIRRRREAFVVLTVLGSALMFAAVPFHFAGNDVAILWLIGAEVFLAAGVAVKERLFARLGLLTGLLVGLHLIRIDFMQLLSARQSSEDLVLGAGVMFGLCALVFYSNAVFVGKRWRDLFGAWFDSRLLVVHSYLGAFAAAAAAWALCSHDWTAVAFAAIMLVLAALGNKLKSIHLQLQYGIMGVLCLYRVAFVNLHTEVAQYTHVPMRLFTLPVIAIAFYASAKLAAVSESPGQRAFRGLFAVAGTALVTSLIYYEVPELWQPAAAIALAVLLLEVGRGVKYHALAWHAHALTALAVLAAVTADQSGIQRWQNVPLHAFGALPVVAGAYWIANRINFPRASHSAFGRLAYSWIGTGLMLWVLNEAVAAPWIAVSWVIFAIALAFAFRWIGYRQLAWQANAVAACTFVRVYNYNLPLEQPLWGAVSMRLATVSLVAGGLYFLSRKATPPDSGRAITYLHTSGATALLVFLAWYEAPGGWLAVVWALFALALALVDRRFELEDLGWQAHALAALTMVRSITVNLHVAETWHGISIRLLSLAIVAVILYALSRIVRMPQDWRKHEFHHVYSWAASALVSLLMWYELQPLSVAVGWAVFGLVLFEYGLLRRTRQFRFQAYLALAAAFGRIFFANLTAGSPDEFWGPRVYTVLPITLILFFVYAQLGDREVARDDNRLHLDVLLGYLGTGSVVAVLYFQFANDWLVTAWAVVIFALFGLALLLNRQIFLYQGVLLTVGTCVRGVMHNLFGASYFTAGDWSGRYFVLGSAVAILLACLPFTFRLRDRYRTQTFPNRWVRAIVQRPEQFMFFAPVILLTLMLALKMRAGMVTVAWGLEGVLIVLLALALNERSFRLTGLILLLVCVAKVLARDAWGLAPRDRYITFIILGAALLLVSFLYSKYRDAIRQFL